MRHTKAALLALTVAIWAVPALCGDIHLPGYETIHLKAGQIPQEVSFRNPKENTCGFRMSIALEDGSLVWKSDDVLKPGDVFTSIDLERELEAGTYRNAVLKYECYTLEDMTRLNGAEMKCSLAVE